MDLPVQGFGDIPMEVLLLIVNDSCLSTQDLYNLATLSRSLNLVALHRYLQAYGIKDATSTFQVALHGGDMDFDDLLKFHHLLAGLAISIHIKSIPTLICNFRIRPSTRVYQYRTPSLSRFQARLDRLTKVILRLKSLPEVHIIDEEEWTENPATPMSDLALREWVTSLGNFMNAILQRGCVTLEVLHTKGAATAHSFGFHLRGPRNLALLFRWMMNRLQKNYNAPSLTALEGPGWEFRRSFGSSKNIMMEVSEEAHQSSNIRYLYLHSTQVLLPPHLPWTLLMIKISPNLTSVSFAYISLNSTIWDALLPLIADTISHQLVELAFSGTCKGLTSRHIIQFLERLNCLEYLKLDQLCDAMISKPCPIGEKNHNACPYPKPNLPHLRVLTAPVKFSNHIIRSQSSLSRIRRWDTFYFDADLSISSNPAPNLDVILRGLSNMLKKEPRTEPLEISTMMGKFYRKWTSFENVINRAGHDSNSIIPIRNAILLDVTGFLFLVESKSLALWLGKTFPNATQLTTSQIFIPQKDRDESERGIIPKTVRELVASISATCPSMRKLVLESWMVDFSKGVENSEVSPAPKSVYTL